MNFKMVIFSFMTLSSPLTLIKIFKLLESFCIFLFPVALVISITATNIIFYSGLITFLILLILKQKHLLLKNVICDLSLINKAFYLYIIAFTFSKLINSGLEASITAFFKSFQLYFIFLWITLYMYEDNNNSKKISFALLISALIAVSYGVLQLLDLDFFHRQKHIDRLSGFHKNPYTYGGQLITFFFLLLNSFLKEDKKFHFKKILGLLFIGLSFLCILNTSERAVIFGVLFGFVVFVLLTINIKVNLTNYFPVSIVLLIPILVTKLINKKAIKRMEGVVRKDKSITKNIRFKIWKIALAIWKKNILFGFGKFPPLIFKTASGAVQNLNHAHNTYLQILVSNGLVGLIAHLNLVYSILITIFRRIDLGNFSICLTSIIFSYLFEGIFEHFWGDSEVKFLFIYFASFVLGNIDLKSERLNVQKSSI